MNDAQKFLIKHGWSDLIINDKPGIRPDQHIYVSDAMMKFLSISQQAISPDEDAVSIKCLICGQVNGHLNCIYGQ